MKKTLLYASSILVAACSIQSATAADITSSAYDWSGFYVGLNAGVALNNTTAESDVLNDDTFPWLGKISNDLTSDDASFTGGALAGYNLQMNSVVLGVEADINYLGFSGDSQNDVTNFDEPLDSSHSLSVEADWFGTIRGRAGFAADNILFYGTGGLAYGNLKAESDFRISNDSAEVLRANGSSNSVNWGWTLGGGIEYGIDRWSLGLEYLYVDLGDADWSAGNTKSYNTEGSVDYQFSVVRATAKLRF